MKLVSRLINLIGFMIYSGLAFAYVPPRKNAGVGGAAKELLEPVTMLSNFIGAASIIIGASFLFASFIKFMQYRNNPLMVPISTVVVLFLLGVILICLPLIYKVTGYGIPLKLF